MNLQGDFEGPFLTSILQLLCDDQNTGILQVNCGTRECKVFFREGTIVYAQSSSKEARLGAILRREKIISAEQLQDALISSQKNNIALGKCLVEKNYISLDVLKQYNKKQAEEILYSMLFWQKGKFHYKDASLQFEGMVVTKLNPMKLILEASRRIDEMSLLTELITSDQLIYTISPKDRSKNHDFEFSPDERCLLSFINGQRTVRDIIDLSHFGEFSAYKALYSLLSSGLIDKSLHKKEEDTGLDFGFILSIYADLFKIITTPLAMESRETASLLVEEAKENLPSSQAKLVRKFHIDAPASVNRKNITLACKKTGGDQIQQRLLLIDSFNGLCHLLLSKTIPVVENQQMYEIIREVDQVTNYVRKYQKDSIEKNKIVNDIKNVLEDTIKQVRLAPQKTKKGGFLSFLK